MKDNLFAHQRLQRYAAWLFRSSNTIFALSALLVFASIHLIAFHLPLHADFAELLPADAPSVRAVQQLESRLSAKDTMLMLVVAPDADARAAAAKESIAGVNALGADLIDRVEADDSETRAFLLAHRHLYAPLSELLAARDELAKRIDRAKARANPLLVDLDDDVRAADGAAARSAEDASIDALRTKEREAEARLAHSAFISADDRAQVIGIKTAFRATDAARDRLLQSKLDALSARVRRDHPAVTIGFTGGVTAAIAEHRALLQGMLLSSLFVAFLVALVLLLHLRSARVLALLSLNIIAATLASFGIAAITVGHLNAATAFLGAIIAGNGINYGILLVARFLEERANRSESSDPVAAMARAIAGTLRPTLVASLGASIAYGALAMTHFRGFRDFAIIGGLGMIVCWIFSLALLPALLLRFPPANNVQVAPLFGKLVLRIFGFRRPALVCIFAALASIAAGLICWRYIARDPFEYDMTQLRSRSEDAALARRWMRFSDDNFGRGLAGVGGQTYLAAEQPVQIPAIVGALRALQTRDPIVGQISSILDAIPPEQEEKILVLNDLRRLIDEAARTKDTSLRNQLLALRPPDDLRPITARDLPLELKTRITEKNGRVGALVAVRPGRTFDEWNGRDLIHFASALRGLHLASGDVSVAGTSLLFADVLTTIQRDGPQVTLAASLGLIALVLTFAGFSRRGAAVLISTFAGSLFMIAACALSGLKINFLDFVALPITLGIGVDYAINIAERASHDDPRATLRTTGGSVLVCSLTTIIGYASLLLSDNLAVRGFGIASLLGELTCITAALVLVPAILTQGRRSAEQQESQYA